MVKTCQGTTNKSVLNKQKWQPYAYVTQKYFQQQFATQTTLLAIIDWLIYIDQQTQLISAPQQLIKKDFSRFRWAYFSRIMSF